MCHVAAGQLRLHETIQRVGDLGAQVIKVQHVLVIVLRVEGIGKHPRSRWREGGVQAEHTNNTFTQHAKMNTSPSAQDFSGTPTQHTAQHTMTI
jgi:hypothetical protein